MCRRGTPHKGALVDLDVPFPVALDNNFAIWRAFRNNYWPALYFVDADGVIRDEELELPRGPVGRGTVLLQVRVAQVGPQHVLHREAQVDRGPNETAEVRMKGRRELLPLPRP